MAAFTISTPGTYYWDDAAFINRSGSDTYTPSGATVNMIIDQDTRYGLNTNPFVGAFNTIIPGATPGGNLLIDGRDVRIIPFDSGAGYVPPWGATIAKGSASGILAGVYSALNVAPLFPGAPMPTTGYLKIRQWNGTAYSSGSITTPVAGSTNLAHSAVSEMEGTLASTDYAITAGAGALTNSLTFANSGTKSLRIAPSSTTTITAATTTTRRFTVGGSAPVTATAYIRGSDVKSCTFSIDWYDSANAFISNSVVQTQNCSNSGFTTYTNSITSPAGAVLGSISFTVISPTSGGFYYCDSVTITTSDLTACNLTGPDDVGWIEVNNVEGGNITLSNSNQTYGDNSLFKGDWYRIGTTDGNRATTYQVPTNGLASYHGGVWVDKAAATTITAATWSAGTATFTSTAHGLTTDDRILIDGPCNPRAWAGLSGTITVTGANTFTMPVTTDPGTWVSGGTCAAKEWYPTTWAVNTLYETDAVRGKVCWLAPSTGLLRFGNDGTTSTGGYIPATGLKIHIPNVFTSSSATGGASNQTNAAPNATISSRTFFYGGSAGIVKLDHFTGVWSPRVWQNSKYVDARDSCFITTMTIATNAQACYLTNICIGGNITGTSSSCLTVSAHAYGLTAIDCVFAGLDVTSGTRQALNLAQANDLIFTRCKLMGHGDRGGTGVWAISSSIGNNATFTDTTIVNCGGIFNPSQHSNVTMSDTVYYATTTGVVGTANPQSMFAVTNVSLNFTIDGLTIPQAGPWNIMRSVFWSVASGCDSSILRNVGTLASPIDSGTSYYTGATWTRVTTTATVTKVAHGFRTGDLIWVNVSASAGASATAAITVGAAKTITVTGADTFTFTCLNAGPTSGTIDFYCAGHSTSISVSAAADSLVQNVHLKGNSGVASSFSATTSGMTMENVSLDEKQYTVTPVNLTLNDMLFRGLSTPSYPNANAGSSIFGTHMYDAFIRPIATPGAETLVTGATWTRVTTTATVTKVGHGLKTNDLIYVWNSSSIAAIIDGFKALSVVVLDVDTFLITCLNAGSASGTFDYRVNGDSRISLVFSDSTTASSPYLTKINDAGFTGSGTGRLQAVGDALTWESPEYITNYLRFPKFQPYVYGSSITATHFDLTYQINTGAGYSASKNLAHRHAGGGGTAATTTVTMTSTTGVNVDDYVWGTGIACDAKVVSVDSATDITVSIANLGTVSGVLTFGHLPNESDFPSTGFKIKVTMTCNTANAGGLYVVDIPLVSDATTRARLYSQLTSRTLTLTGLQTGSDISIRTQNTVGSNLVNVDANAGTTYAYTYDYIAGTYIDIAVYKAGYKVAEVTDYLLTDADVSYPISQPIDLEYA